MHVIAQNNTSGRSERILESRDRGREEVLSSLGQHPLSGKGERSSLRIGVRTRDGARRAAVRRLANDGVESRLLWLIDREADIVCPG